jgi:hypothetical protein
VFSPFWLDYTDIHASPRIPIAHMQIPAGSLVKNRVMDPLPEGWTMYIHPEGKPYYHRQAMEPEANLLQGVSTDFSSLEPRSRF